MKGLLARRPSAAMVVAVVALVMASIGTGIAALQLPKNSVGTKQIKKNAVTTAKIKKNAVTGAKVKKGTLTGSDINLNKLGTVPSANVANSLIPLEATHIVGAAGEPAFQSGSKNAPAGGGITFPPVGFFKDHSGIVHLEGLAEVGGEGPVPGIIFTLPPGYRPASGISQIYLPAGEPVLVFGSGVSIEGTNVEGAVFAPTGAGFLSGITFRAGS